MPIIEVIYVNSKLHQRSHVYFSQGLEYFAKGIDQNYIHLELNPLDGVFLIEV